MKPEIAYKTADRRTLLAWCVWLVNYAAKATHSAGLGISISQSIHHFCESTPMDSLGRLPSRAGPEQRSPTDLQLAELEILAVDLQRERGLRLGESCVMNLGLHFISVR